MAKTKRDPWVVIDNMTGEHVQRFADETSALKFAVTANAKGNVYDVRFWR